MSYRVPDRTHDLLLNWSRWCWLGAWPHPLPPTHCGSIESEYRPLSSSVKDDEEAPPPNRIRPNESDARLVNDVWKTVQRSLLGLVMKAEYPGRDTSGRNDGREVAARYLCMSLPHYEGHLQTAVNLLEVAIATRPRNH